MNRDETDEAEERIYIGVVGPGNADPSQLHAAESIGRALAGAGWALVCGGLGGVMAAACRGAVQAGGMTIGLLPGTSRREGNADLTVSIPTGLGELRNGLIVRASDAVVAIGGSWGTLSEISLALRTGRPVLGLGTWPIDTGDGSLPTVRPVDQPEDVVPALRALLTAASSGTSRSHGKRRS
ncbi:DNA processing protein [Frankia sp. AiPs1]|uniref:TIGR00725 family protein n=1 Tax=Frankia sp. AiPa1 TaxID=573492 RepID=UPI00202B277B|nr:TIGR00725 family protein [Frankia sp. AiPa1]MCL9760432.1 TIGR00725 family protein [Frankia sp. AiPa1]